MKTNLRLVQIALYLLSPYLALQAAHAIPTMMDELFLLYFVLVVIAEWLALAVFSKIIDEIDKK